MKKITFIPLMIDITNGRIQIREWGPLPSSILGEHDFGFSSYQIASYYDV